MKISFLFILLSSWSYSQDYIDLVSVTMGKNLSATFENSISTTSANTLDISTVFPVVMNEKNTFITGVDFSSTSISLFPETSSSLLYSTTVKLGLATTFSEKWSTTFVLLPKLASDYRTISTKDFYLGGVALLKWQKNKKLKYRFGIYASSEAFGLFTTPIIGIYYLSKNNRLEIDASLPISATISYRLKKFTTGIDYVGLGRSYTLNMYPNVYVEQNPLEFSLFFEFKPIGNSFLLRGKIGYTSNEHEVYEINDTLAYKISAFEFGGQRNQLNPTLSGALFIRAQGIYRFTISKK